MMSEIRSMNVDFGLKEDLEESVRECSSFVVSLIWLYFHLF